MKNSNRPQKGELYLNGVIFNGEKTLDIMLPGNKVGFVIGKGGEMIRNLQVIHFLHYMILFLLLGQSWS